MAEQSSTDPSEPTGPRPSDLDVSGVPAEPQLPPPAQEPSPTAGGSTLPAADRGRTDALLALARLRERAGDHPGAEALYRQAVDRGHIDALLALARLRERAGDHPGAEALYRQAVDCGRIDALLALARLRERAGDHAGAQALAAEETTRRRRRVPPEGGDRRRARCLAHLPPTAAGHRRALGGIVVSLLALIVLLGLGGLLWQTNSTKKNPAGFPVVAASPTLTMPSPTRTMPSLTTRKCHEDISRFLRAVHRVDHDEDELRGLDDAARVRLGRAALTDPSVLRETRLLPFQYPGFLRAARRWLCPVSRPRRAPDAAPVEGQENSPRGLS